MCDQATATDYHQFLYAEENEDCSFFDQKHIVWLHCKRQMYRSYLGG